MFSIGFLISFWYSLYSIFDLLSSYDLGYFAMHFFVSRFFRLVSQIISEFITIDFYNLFTPTCTSSFYPDDHLGRFMGFSRFVELKSARFVEKLRKIKKDIKRYCK